jgi:hypothetical protein
METMLVAMPALGPQHETQRAEGRWPEEQQEDPQCCQRELEKRFFLSCLPLGVVILLSIQASCPQLVSSC